MGFVAVKKESEYVAAEDADNENYRDDRAAVVELYRIGEKPEAQHVEEQMSDVGMQHASGQQAVVFLVLPDRKNIEQHVGNQLWPGEGKEGNDCGRGNYGKGEGAGGCKIHGMMTEPMEMGFAI